MAVCCHNCPNGVSGVQLNVKPIDYFLSLWIYWPTKVCFLALELMEGHSGYTVQSQTQECEGTPGPSDSTDWGPRQKAGQRNHQFMEGQGGKEVAGEGKNKGIEADEGPKHWDNKAESNCRYTCSQNITKSEVSLLDMCLLCSAFILLGCFWEDSNWQTAQRQKQ